jgi:hypothetical protein
MFKENYLRIIRSIPKYTSSRFDVKFQPSIIVKGNLIWQTNFALLVLLTMLMENL